MKDTKGTKTIDFTNLFNQQRKDSPLAIKIAFRDAFKIFIEDPENEILRNHSLKTLEKKYFGVWEC
jgi:hypothetical protein